LKNAVVLVAIGLAALLGAIALAWYAALATLDLDKAGGRGASAQITRKLFGLVPLGEERIADVAAARMVASREPGSQSRTPPRLVFVTLSGDERDLGYEQQRFARDFPDIRDFLADASRTRLRLSSARDTSETVRFVAAQAGAVVLLLIGVGAISAGVGRLRAR
jgi:hypothetical protein